MQIPKGWGVCQAKERKKPGVGIGRGKEKKKKVWESGQICD